MSLFETTVGVCVLVVIYIVLGFITYHSAPLYSFLDKVMTCWGNRERITQYDWERSLKCYDDYGSFLFGTEPLFSVLWPIAWGVVLIRTPFRLIISAYKRYLSEASVKKLNSPYRLRPKWMNIKSIVNTINRFM